MKTGRNGYTHEVRLLTFGHGTHSEPDLAGLISRAGIRRVVDVRTTPRSRRHPWVWREELEQWVPRDAGAQYEWNPELGGRRKTSPESKNTALRNSAFRGYADYMETPQFQDALTQLASRLDAMQHAIMCSETLWWRCHRRLISDAATLLHGVSVEHLDAHGNAKPHVPTPEARVVDRLLRYD